MFSLLAAGPADPGLPGSDDPLRNGVRISVGRTSPLEYFYALSDTPPPVANPNAGPGDPSTRSYDTPWEMPPPSNVETVFELDEEGEGYYVHEQVGGIDVRPPSYMTMAEYLEWRKNNGIRDYFHDRASTSTAMGGGNGLEPKFVVDNPAFRDIFGGGSVEIRPNGTALLDLGMDFNRSENPSLPIRQQRTSNFRFDQQIQLNVVGKIGERMRLNANWDTQANFDFENQIKLAYTGSPDQILQTVEAGNVSLPLQGSLIQGGQNLFGIKVGMKFGPLMVTSIASQQKGKTQTVTATGGSQRTEFSKKGNEYDEYRHFFLSHFFRNRYEYAVSNLPNINSNIYISRVEVWITNNNSASTQDNRNAVGFIDLGETEVAPNSGFPTQNGRIFNPVWQQVLSYPDNGANNLYATLESDSIYRERASTENALMTNLNLQNGLDFQKVENMRKLKETEYTVNRQLGYISLGTQLQANQVLFVAYEFQIGNQAFQVGDFTMDKPSNGLNSNVLFLKMLKPASVRPTHNNAPYPTWDLMMKNIYSIGGYGLKADNFRLNIMYESGTGSGTIAYLPTSAVKDVPLLQVFGVDKLTNNSESRADNVFDFLENKTVVPDKGLIIFPVLEPFGSHLERKMNGDQQEADKYVFNELYDRTRQDAINYSPQKDRFYLKGSYQSASSAEISLNSINVAPGSVKVTANGVQLTEGTDYIVDYNVGKVTIQNQGILTSGQELQVTFETNTLFGIDTKTLLGTRMDLNLNKNLQLGGTILNLNERPITQKINIGDEPINNVLWGLDGNWRRDSRYLTKLVDKLPLLQTKEVSNVQIQAEGAQLIPGHPKSIQVKGQEDGIGYLDDFESAKTTFDLMGARNWILSSFPGNNGNNDMVVPGPGLNAALSPNYTRAKLAWYTIDPTFYTNGDLVSVDTVNSNHYTRQVNPNEVFPGQTLQSTDRVLRTFDLYYLPQQRGPYNYQADPGKIAPDGSFRTPEENWAGLMRRTSGNTDFEAANFEFIEFWMMDPFADPDGSGPLQPKVNGGELYFDLGQISEDVVPDGNRNFENGLPTSADGFDIVGTTAWGHYPLTTPPNLAFDNNEESREFQDVGFDGMRNAEERSHFAQYLIDIRSAITANPGLLTAIEADPSSDDYQYFRSSALGTSLLNRYLNNNGIHGNTPLNANEGGYNTQGSPNPDTEDINANGTLNTNEDYYEYKLRLNPADMQVGRNYIVDVIPAEVTLPLGTQTTNINWYQFRIPLTAGVPVGAIQNFKAIDFIRMYMKGWQSETNIRFAKFQLVSTSWRTFRDYLGPESDTLIVDPTDQTSFEIGTVNIEENGSRQPFNYMTPPNIVRQNQVGGIQQGLLQNEQSMVLKVCNLQDGDGRGAFKLVNYDLRAYQKMKLWLHAENVDGSSQQWQEGDLMAFVRVGSDNTQNYYEYEIPLKPSAPGDQDSSNVWANLMEVELADLNTAKALRDDQNYPRTNRFEYVNAQGHRIFIVGTPRMSEVRTLMIGIRNKNDGRGPICAEVWANELRVTDFNESPGYAVNARMNLKLADFANISLTGSKKTPGFGALNQKINSRSREDITQYDITGQFNMGKFFPAKWGIQLPLYMTYGERLVDPQYNPLESDVLLDNYLEAISDTTKRDSIRRALQDHTVSKSISLNQVRKVKVMDPVKGGKPPKTHFWDVENFSLNASYNEIYQTNHLVEKRLNTNHRAGLSYAYTFQNKPIQLFKDPKHKNPITLLNFNPFPKNVGASIQGDRRYEENWIRPTANSIPIDPTYFKNFIVTRQYNLRWDFTKSLSLTYNATNVSRVDEPFDALTPQNKDSVWTNLFSIGREVDSLGRPIQGKDKYINIGRNTRYTQQIGVNYVLPLDQFPWTDWISSTASYQGGLNWTVAPDNQPEIGNLLGNSMDLQATARLNLERLYKKIRPFRTLLEDSKSTTATTPPKAGPTKPTETAPKPDAANATATKDSTQQDNLVFLRAIGKTLGRMLLSIRNLDGQWSRNMTTSLPGYVPQTDNFGVDYHFTDGAGRGSVPPGYPFILGVQPDTAWLSHTAAANGWLSTSTSMLAPFQQTFNEQLSARTSVTPFKDFKIDLNITRTRQENYSEIFRYDSLGPSTGQYLHENSLLNGSFSISYIFLGTAFQKNEAVTPAYLELEQNSRRVLSQRLITANPNSGVIPGRSILSDEYFNGYYRNSQDVVIPAFLSAYGMGSASTVSLNPFKTMPLPNWTVNYNGLKNLDFFKKFASNVTLKHTYRGTYTIGGYTSNINYEGDEFGFASNFVAVGIDTLSRDTIFNFRPNRVIPSVSFTEAFTPLAGFNLTLKNGISVGLDYKTSRTITLAVGNLQLTEKRDKDIALNFAWRKDKLNKTLNLFGREMKLENALNTRLDITLRDTKTRNRMLDSEVPPVFTAGNFMLIIRPAVDYTVNTRLNITVYAEHTRNKPAISTSFASSRTSAGVKVRFTLN